MTLNSMTGYARIDGQNDLCAWSWEIKSVNAKGLDIRCRLASGFEALDTQVRNRMSKQLNRGNVTVGLTVDWQRASGGVQINREALDLILSEVPAIEARLATSEPSSATGILSVRGVIETVEFDVSDEEREDTGASILADFDKALAALVDMRQAEGARLHPVLAEQLNEIAELTRRSKENAASQPGAIRQRLEGQLEEILDGRAGLPEERMAHEVALLVTKADIREEIDRLAAHEKAAREYLASDDAVGRKLDFLCQEFNREANTLCSKSTDVGLTQIGLDLKSIIERFREQIQNIE